MYAATDGLGRRSRWFTATSLLDLSPLTELQKRHMTKVYTTLALCSLLTFLSVAVPGPWLNVPPLLGIILFFMSLFYITSTSGSVRSSKDVLSMKRLAALAIMCVAQGAIVREHVMVLMYINPEIITTALMGSIAVFSSFSLGSLFMKSRLWLYIGSLAYSILSYTSLVMLANIFFRSKFVYNVLTIAGLLMYSGFVIFDTQVTLKDFDSGNKDYVVHAISLYADLIGIFLKLTEILYEKEQKKQKKTVH